MKMYILSSDHDALTGFRLAGVKGRLIGDEAELKNAFGDLKKSLDAGIVLVTAELFEKFPKALDELSKGNSFVVTQVPDSKHTQTENRIMRYVHDAIGIS